MTLFRCFHCYLLTYFTPFSSVSIVDFDQVNVSWECELSFRWHSLITAKVYMKFPLPKIKLTRARLYLKLCNIRTSVLTLKKNAELSKAEFKNKRIFTWTWKPVLCVSWTSKLILIQAIASLFCKPRNHFFALAKELIDHSKIVSPKNQLFLTHPLLVTLCR